ncbi:hypothetical protein Kpho02_50550 [Kitasatospora phosalacinea]|uniref:Uncharacterized protein n=1 Tax=Kitasatospora phosalacinea TaxID=2065 RepID=A0A9W6QD22_9ACTN|nr:hypothetical protein Kpho02_50550 [Kitasatospora phosalacinea]
MAGQDGARGATRAGLRLSHVFSSFRGLEQAGSTPVMLVHAWPELIKVAVRRPVRATAPPRGGAGGAVQPQFPCPDREMAGRAAAPRRSSRLCNDPPRPLTLPEVN